jgi:hypothetical protein
MSSTTDSKLWVRLAKLEFPYSVVEIYQKDQNNWDIHQNTCCSDSKCAKMIGTCTHGDVPQMFHALYLSANGMQIPIPTPSRQEKVLLGLSPDVLRAIFRESAERGRKKRKTKEEQAIDDAEVQTILDADDDQKEVKENAEKEDKPKKQHTKKT